MKKFFCGACLICALIFQTNIFAEEATAGEVAKTSTENATKSASWGIGLCALVIIAGMAAIIAAYSSSSPATTAAAHAHD